MKQVILVLLLGIGLSLTFSGCERNDYQHPMHRK